MKSRQAIIGVDILDTEIRVVEVRYRGNQPQVAQLATTRLADGIVHRGTILLPAALAVALRTLLDSMGKPGTNRASFGVPIDRAVLRTFSLPPAKSEEIPLIVAGEVEHHGMIQGEGGAHGFFELNRPEDNSELRSAQVAVFVIDEPVIAELREVANRAGLSIASIEPTSLAMYRAGAISCGDEEPTFSLTIGDAGSEIAFTSEGNLRAYRRLEAGSRSILGEIIRRRHSDYSFPDEQARYVDPASQPASIIEPPSLVEAGVNALCTEVRRTLNYFARELEETATVDRLRVHVDNPDLTPLIARLEEELNIKVELAQPDIKLAENPLVATELSSIDGIQYTAAIGLALHFASTEMTSAPRIDLYSEERKEVLWMESAKNLWGSMIVSAIALVLAGVFFFLFGSQISAVKAQTKAAKEKAAKIQSETDRMAAEATRKLKQYMALRKEGTPIGSIADVVASTIEPGVGISNINVSNTFQVSIGGEAIDENAMLRSLQRMQQSPLIQNLAISSFNRRDNSNGVAFQLTAQAVSMDQIRLPGEAKR